MGRILKGNNTNNNIATIITTNDDNDDINGYKFVFPYEFAENNVSIIFTFKFSLISCYLPFFSPHFPS